jgi:ADP-L-glycero-D-manno-heptose 6-epimerase
MNASTKNRFIVTGAAGFIGRNLVAALNARGARDVLIVDRLDAANKLNLNDLRFSAYMDKGDFRRDILADKVKPVDTVFHIGACSSTTETDEKYITDNNFQYTRDLCDWCLNHNTRFIYASSAATYGDGSLGYSDADDITPKLRPLNLYGWSKQNFDTWALNNRHFNRIVGLKYFNVYGPHEDHKDDMRSVVNKAYGQILKTDEVKLFKSYDPKYKDGEQERDFVYVKDAVKVTLFFHDHPDVSGLFNCGTGNARTWLDLVNAVFAAMERKPNISFIEMPDNIRDKYQYHTEADVSKLRKAEYKEEFTSLENGVRDYVQGYLAKKNV